MKLAEYEQQIKHLNIKTGKKGPLPKEEIYKQIEEILKTKPVKRYAMLIHDKDEAEEHIHIEMELNSSQTAENISKWFNDKANRIQKAKTKGKYAFANMLSYLIHATETADGKYQYKPEEVRANFDFKEEVKQIKNEVENSKEYKKIDDLINKIVNNEIYRSDLKEHLTGAQEVKYNTALKKAFEVRDRRNREKRKEQGGASKDMKVIYICGKSGTGKTTLAKMLAEQKTKDYFVSGSSNDPLEDYDGQKVIILDELRGSQWKIADILKLLDNNTDSKQKSRYYNKYITECELIIITSTKSIEELYKGLQEKDGEEQTQLKRRINQVIVLTEDRMQTAEYDQDLKEHIITNEGPNPVNIKKFADSMERKNDELMEDLIKIYPKEQQEQMRKNYEETKKRAKEIIVGYDNKSGKLITW